MKGGNNAMVYYYDAAGAGVDDSDTGLTTPINPARTGSCTASAMSTSASIRRRRRRRRPRRSRRPRRPRGRRSTPGTSRSRSTSRSSLRGRRERDRQLDRRGDADGIHGPERSRLGHDHGREPERRRRDGRGGHRRARGHRVVDCDAEDRLGAEHGLTVPANSSISCTYSAPRTRSTEARTRHRDRHAGRHRRVRQRHRRLHVRPAGGRDQQAVSAVDDENEWTRHRRQRHVHLRGDVPLPRTGPDERRRPSRRQPGDPGGRDGLRARHRLGERDGDVRQPPRRLRLLRLRR